MRFLMVILGMALLAVAGLRLLKNQESGPIVRLETPAGDVPKELREYWAIPNFALTERSGRAVTLEDLKGKVWVADFFYSTCPGPCPMLSSRLSDVHKEFAGEAGLRLVSITTNPANDTPEVLDAYAKRFEASDRWLFLTGDKQEIFTLANQGFKLSVADDPSAKEPVTHSTKLVLVDRKGTVRGFYDGLDSAGGKNLANDIRRLLGEKQ